MTRSATDPTVKPEDILKVGDEIEVFVVRVNDAEGTVQLSKKKLDGLKVWDEVEAACENKDVVEGTITEENKGGLVANVERHPRVHPRFSVRHRQGR